jgi:hypothetical protein
LEDAESLFHEKMKNYIRKIKRAEVPAAAGGLAMTGVALALVFLKGGFYGSKSSTENKGQG